jgi:hypothetical protein
MALVADVREKKEGTGSNFPKYVGYFEAEVVGINPTAKEWTEIYGAEPKKELEYLKNKDGVASLDVLVVLQDVKTKNLFQLKFWLKDIKRVGNKSGKNQYINTIGKTDWAFSEDDLHDWFLKDGRDYRQAYEQEEQFVKFLRTWLGKLDFTKPEAVLQLNWKKLMNGNIDEWKELIGHEWTTTVGALATVKLDDETSRQNVFNGAFFAGYDIKSLRQFDYTRPETINSIKFRANKDMKRHDWFIKDVTGEFGPKDFYVLKELTVYDPNNSPENGKVISAESDEY